MIENMLHEMMPNLFSITTVGAMPFSIALTDEDTFECVEVVRVVPKRRLVCRGSFKSKSVYAKIFIGKSASHYALRDKAGVEALKKSGIETPDLLLARELNDGAYILIYTAIEHSRNAEEALQHLAEQPRFVLMQKLVQTVAQHHRAGLLQTDLYFKNFLVQQEANQADLIYTLDGDGIRYLSPFFQHRQKFRNLAILFSKMDVLDDVWISELYKLYCLHSGMVYSYEKEAEIWCLTQKIRHQMVKSYADKKVFRSCTDVKVTQCFKRFEAVASDFKIKGQVLASLDDFLADAQHNIKNGNTCTVAKATLENQQVIIKRYNVKDFWHGLNRAFRVSRAAKSWANAHRLIISNIATPEPLALIEERFGCIRRRAYYLSEYIDAPDVMQFFSQSIQLEDKKIVASNLATLFYKLYLLKISHGDCKASNIKIVNFMPVLIDLDGMQAHFGSVLGYWWFERQHIKDLQRLMENWIDDAETTNLLKQAFQLEYTLQHPYENDDDILFRAGIV